MRRSLGGTQEREACHVRCKITFFIVALDAGRYQIFPTVRTSSRLGNDMIDGEGWRHGATVLTSVTIAAENIFPRKHDALERYAMVLFQADHTGERPSGVDGTNAPFFVVDHEFGFMEKEHNHCFLHVADADRFIALVQYQDTSTDRDGTLLYYFEDILLASRSDTMVQCMAIPREFQSSGSREQ